MRTVNFFVVLLSFALAGCAGNRAATAPSADYVEIDNPAITITPNAPPTIWVPRSYVESGVPRGGELVRQGYDAAKSKLVGPQAPAEQQPAAAVATTPPPATVCAVKNRIAALEIGDNGLAAPFNEAVRVASAGIMLDPSQIAFLARYASMDTPAERGSFAARLGEDYGANLVIFVFAPDGIVPGKTLKAELVDGMGGVVVREFYATIPGFSASDSASREFAVTATLQKLAGGVRELAPLIPWYGKVVAVEGGRVYINAGKEAGLRPGQALKIYRGGKVVPGLGFAPGNRIASMEVSGFVGANGAYGLPKEGGEVQVSDLVSTD